jgi:[DsrC]-trisulfide reductase subunit J
MRDRLWIIAGLFLFLGLITYPAWHDLAARTTSKGPDLVLPANEKDCVAPVSYMRTSHMKLLLTWRDEVVRHDQHTYTSFDGKVYSMSLSGTCLRCHNKERFCDRCHSYVGVSTPYCWNCHVDPALAQRSAR